MSDTLMGTSFDNSNSSLYEILKNCVNLASYDSLPTEDYTDVCAQPNICDYYKMIATNSFSTSGNISTSSYASDESFGDNILEEDGRISLAYENLHTIPRRIAEKFATQTRFLDLSYNHFQNLSFLSFFEELHTLILDRNSRLNLNTLPLLPNLKILWINNCDISNLAEWVQRIQTHCPSLEHLSIMGNPGVNEQFHYNSIDADTALPITMSTNCHDYVLHLLPKLLYLNGVPCRQYIAIIPTEHKLEKVSDSSTPFTTPLLQSNGRSHLPHNGSNGSTPTDYKPRKDSMTRVTPVHTLKDFFRLKRRKKSYHSALTN